MTRKIYDLANIRVLDKPDDRFSYPEKTHFDYYMQTVPGWDVEKSCHSIWNWTIFESRPNKVQSNLLLQAYKQNCVCWKLKIWFFHILNYTNWNNLKCGSMMGGFKSKRRLVATSVWPIITVTYLYSNLLSD